MSEFWTPGQRPSGPLTIYLPTGYAEKPRPFVCRVPVGEVTCGERFETEAQLDAHVRRCVSRHDREINAESPRTRMPVFDEANWDPEVAAHMRALGKRMRSERRLTVKPSERAGFS